MRTPLLTTAWLSCVLGVPIFATGSSVAKESAEVKPATVPGLEANQLQLDFRDAPLESVLNYLSDAAGFIIVNQTGGTLSGEMTVYSDQPVSKDKAVDLRYP